MSTAYNAQFFQLDFRLIDDPDFLEFLRKPAFAAYLVLARHIWRGGRHPIERVNELRRKGSLVAVVTARRWSPASVWATSATSRGCSATSKSAA